jgi:glycosyltransferase involved in cell wall biosynthesis
LDESDDKRPALLVLDASYTLEMIRERGIENSVLCRDLDGFFRHVWSVHPFATLLTSERWTPRYGRPVSHQLAPRHSFIEGKVGRFESLKRLFALNFALSQIDLLTGLWRLVRRERICVIRAGDPLYLGLLGWMLARLTGAAFVIRVNGNNDKIRQTTGQRIFPRLFPSIAAEKRVERFTLRRADLVFAPNEDNAAFAVANGAEASGVAMINFGTLLAAEHFADPSLRPAPGRYLAEIGVEPGNFIICIGRLIAPKFPDHVVRVLAGVRTVRPGIKAVFVGDGPMRADLEKLAAELGVADAVIFAGNRNQDFLSRVLPHAAVVVSPSTGRALSEAALAAVPIVAYDTDWQKDMIETEVTGILVPYRDHEAMTAAAVRFLEDSAFAAAMAAAVRKRALIMLDPAAGADAERTCYRKLLNPHYERRAA